MNVDRDSDQEVTLSVVQFWEPLSHECTSWIIFVMGNAENWSSTLNYVHDEIDNISRIRGDNGFLPKQSKHSKAS
jgi:hypothetical protein